MVILVGSTNREALVSGLKQGSFNENNLILCDTRAEAFLKLNEIIKKDDLILIENDLPDLYEVVESF
jgi:spore maturation protein CgeB